MLKQRHFAHWVVCWNFNELLRFVRVLQTLRKIMKKFLVLLSMIKPIFFFYHIHKRSKR